MASRHPGQVTFSVGGVQMTLNRRQPPPTAAAAAATSPAVVPPGSPEGPNKDEEDGLLQPTDTTAKKDPPGQLSGAAESLFDDLDLDMTLSPLPDDPTAHLTTGQPQPQQLQRDHDLDLNPILAPAAARNQAVCSSHIGVSLTVPRSQYDKDMQALRERHQRELEQQEATLLSRVSRKVDEVTGDVAENIRQALVKKEQVYQRYMERVRLKHQQETAQLEATIAELKQQAAKQQLEVDPDVASLCQQKEAQYRKTRHEMRHVLASSSNDQRVQEVLEQEERVYAEFTTGITTQLHILQAIHFNQQSKDRETITTLEYTISQQNQALERNSDRQNTQQREFQTLQHSYQQLQQSHQQLQLKHEKNHKAFLNQQNEFRQLQLQQLKHDKELLERDANSTYLEKDIQIAQLRQEAQNKDDTIRQLNHRISQLASGMNSMTSPSGPHENGILDNSKISYEQLERELKQLHVTRLQEAKGYRFRLESMAKKLAHESREHVRKTDLISDLQGRLTKQFDENREKQELIDNLEFIIEGQQKHITPEASPDGSRDQRRAKRRRV